MGGNMGSVHIGIDVGGSKIELIMVDYTLKQLNRKRVQLPQGDYTETLQALVQLIKVAESMHGDAQTVGIGIPGALSTQTGRVINSPSTPLQGHLFLEDIQTLLSRHVTIANDANCFALSEATDGAGAVYRVVFGAILGTGVGGGIVINGQLLRGTNNISGEWGHNDFPVSPSLMEASMGRP
jgi:predicted NBD/HSP70 family sugar kinase